jgi:hypothetical protein
VTNKGWQCPVCEAVYNPRVDKCFKCKPRLSELDALVQEVHEGIISIVAKNEALNGNKL